MGRNAHGDYVQDDLYRGRGPNDPEPLGWGDARREALYDPYRDFHGFEAQIEHQSGLAPTRVDAYRANGQMRQQQAQAATNVMGLAGARGNSPSAMRAAANANAMGQHRTNIAARQNDTAAKLASAQFDMDAWGRRMDMFDRMRRANMDSRGIQQGAHARWDDLENKKNAHDLNVEYDEGLGTANAIFAGGGTAAMAGASAYESSQRDGDQPSDKRLKHRVRELEDELERERRAQVSAAPSKLDEDHLETARSLESSAYRYTPEAQAKLGVPSEIQYGPMAQELEQTPVGASLVRDTPDGKMVDVKAATMAQFGMIGAQEREIERLKRQLGHGGTHTANERNGRGY